MPNKKFTVHTTVTITPTPREIAEAFWDLDARQQATFFDHLQKISGGSLTLQMAYASDHFTADAKLAVRTIGEYAE